MIELKRYKVDDYPIEYNSNGYIFSFMIDDIPSNPRYGDITSLIDLKNLITYKLSKIECRYYRITDHYKIKNYNEVIKHLSLDIGFMSRIFEIITVMSENIPLNSIDISDITNDNSIINIGASDDDVILLWNIDRLATNKNYKHIITIL